MTTEELLKEKGVETVEELVSKIENETKATALTDYEEQKTGLKKQITDLETIKASQGDEVGNLRKNLKEAQEKLEQIDEKKVETEDAVVVEQTDWAKKNEAREAAFTDADWAKLDVALKGATENTKKLATSTEEGRAAFADAILGASNTPSQETFRRPTQEVKLSVAEQIQQGLGILKPNNAPTMRPSGSGYSPSAGAHTNAPQENKPQRKAINPFMSSGSIKDRIASAQTGDK